MSDSEDKTGISTYGLALLALEKLRERNMAGRGGYGIENALKIALSERMIAATLKSQGLKTDPVHVAMADHEVVLAALRGKPDAQTDDMAATLDTLYKSFAPLVAGRGIEMTCDEVERLRGERFKQDERVKYGMMVEKLVRQGEVHAVMTDVFKHPLVESMVRLIVAAERDMGRDTPYITPILSSFREDCARSGAGSLHARAAEVIYCAAEKMGQGPDFKAETREKSGKLMQAFAKSCTKENRHVAAITKGLRAVVDAAKKDASFGYVPDPKSLQAFAMRLRRNPGTFRLS